MKKSLLLIVTLSLMMPAYAAFADDADSQMHDAVSNKVQADHKADLEAGHGHIQKASGSSSSSTGKSSTVSGPALKPMQIQQLKKKKGTPPPPKTTGH